MSSSRNSITFWGTVAAVWTALRLKKEYDEYNAVATDDDPEGRIRLPNTPRNAEQGAGGEDDVSLLDTNVRVRRQKKKSTGCCVCCGVDCTLFWKAFAFVLALWSLFGIYKVARWALTPTPDGLENMPAFGEDLGCESASTFYKDSPRGYILNAPTPMDKHHIKLMGSGVGTLILTAGASDATEVSYNIVMKGTDQPLLDLVKLDVTETSFGSSLAFNTPSISRADLASGNKCIRFDVVLAVPPTLKRLTIQGSSTMQVKFADDAHLDLENLSIVLTTKDEKNMILPTSKVHADSLSLEVYNGWIVGETALVNVADITTQRADGVANVKVYPTDPTEEDGGKVKTATLRTATGSGRSDFWYITNKHSAKRPINSNHISARNGDVYLKYDQADFNGKISLTTRTYSIHGAVKDLKLGSRLPRRRRSDEGTEWTHSRGDAEGGDKLIIQSNGWTGLWF